jgi:pimeloyl-ACP methyl ester carboxylesterase
MMKRVEWRVGDDVVRGRLYTPSGTRKSPAPLVVVMHGLASSAAEFYDFPEKIVDGKHAVLTFDYRGHGASDGPRGVLSADRVEADLRAGLEAMAHEYQIDTQRVALLGHSLGGGLALTVAPKIPEVRLVIALAPIARLRDEMNLFEFAGYNAARIINGPLSLLLPKGISVPYKVDYKRLYVSKEAVRRAERDKFLQSMIPVKNYKPLVQDLDGEAAARQVKVPTLVLVAEFDQVVKKGNSRRVYEALAGPKKFVEVPRSGHSMCGDERGDFVAAMVREFLSKHLGAAS